MKRGLAEVLKREGYIWDWEEVDPQPANQLRLDLKYGPNGERVIRTFEARQQAGPPRLLRRHEAQARAQRLGNFDHQHQPRRDQRPRGAAAQAGRRSVVRAVVEKRLAISF